MSIRINYEKWYEGDEYYWGLEPGDFEQVFLEIRRELKRQGKSLTLLIEDITAFTGVNVALLNVLSYNNTGMYEDLCRISSIIGTMCSISNSLCFL